MVILEPTRQLDVGCKRQVSRWGTPWVWVNYSNTNNNYHWLLTLKPRSLKGESNSRAPFVADSTFSQNPLKPCFSLCLEKNKGHVVKGEILKQSPEFSLSLFCCQVVPVVHVLVLSKVSRDFTHLQIWRHQTFPAKSGIPLCRTGHRTASSFQTWLGS